MDESLSEMGSARRGDPPGEDEGGLGEWGRSKKPDSRIEMRMLEERDAVSSRRREWRREIMAASEADERERKGRAMLEVVEGTAKGCD